MRTKPTLCFRALLAQHSFALAAFNLLRCSASHRTSRSQVSIRVELKSHLQRVENVPERCGQSCRQRLSVLGPL